MARPIKKSLDYFSLDVGIFNDRKIKRLLKDFGGKGFSIYIYLLTQIYGDKGYYLIWDSFYPDDVADALGNGFTSNLVVEVLSFCVKNGLFDKDSFSKSIITSKSIQARYAEAKGADKSNLDSLILPEHNLLTQKVELNDIKSDLTELNDIKSDLTELNCVLSLKKSKVKETKEKENKENNNMRFTKPTIQEIDSYAKEYLQIKGYLIDFNAERFFDFYESKAWFVGKNKMKDWKAAIRNWINNDKNLVSAASSAKPSESRQAIMQEFLNGN